MRLKKVISMLCIASMLVSCVVPTSTYATETGDELLQVQGDFVIENGVLVDYVGSDTVKEIVVPDGVTEIGDYAFEKCFDLAFVTLPEGLVKIGAHAFDRCTSLRVINIPESVKEIGDGAFYWCDSLKRLTIPNSVESIGEGVFAKCYVFEAIITNYGSAAYEYAVKNNIPYQLLDWKELTDEVTQTFVQIDNALLVEEGLSLHVNIISAGEALEALTNAFTDEAVLYDVSFVKDELEVSVEGAMNLRLVLPIHINGTYARVYRVGSDGTLTELKYTVGLYEGRQAIWLNEAEMGKFLIVESHVNGNVEADFVIEEGMLKDYLCNDGVVTIPESVTAIADGAFQAKALVKEIVLPKGLKTIGTSAFEGLSLSKIELPEGLESIGEGAFRGTKLTSVIIPESITALDKEVFSYTELQEVVLPSTLKTIGEGTFAETKLEAIVLPVNMESIGRAAFAGTSLKSITIPESITVIEEGVFQETDLEEVVLSSKTTEIKDNAFKGSKLTSIIIPDSVTVVGYEAFADIECADGQEFVIKGKSMSYVESYATANGLKFEPTNEQLQGDVNGNGEYEAVDALGILKMVVKLETTYGYSADANADGEVTAEDALTVLRKVVGLE